MRSSDLALCLIALAVVAGCASPPKLVPPQGVHGSSYQIGESATVDVGAASAELAHRIATETLQDGSPLQTPIRLLEGAPPLTPLEASQRQIEGEVRVRISFDAQGLVRKVEVVRSADAVLSAAVVDAVSRWRIAPRAGGGFVAYQTFTFKAAGP